MKQNKEKAGLDFDTLAILKANIVCLKIGLLKTPYYSKDLSKL